MDTSIIYVSPLHGEDQGDGVRTPYRTLHHALAAIKERRAAGERQPYTIVLQEDYYARETLLIDQPNVTVTSLGERKKIIGGVRLEGWKDDVFNGVPCQSAPLPEGVGPFTDLWVDEVRADATRYPREGEIPALETENPREKKSENLFTPSKWIKADLTGVDGVEDAIINYYHYWIDEHSPIESYDPETKKLTMTYASRFMINTDLSTTAGMKFFLTHVPSTFGKKNEWYLDHKTRTVYYAGKPKIAYAPTLQKLIEIRAEGVELRNLEIVCSRGDYRSTAMGNGIDAFGSDIQSVCWAPAAVTFENAKNCSVEGCLLHHLGIHAVEIKTGCTAIRIENNTVTDLGAGGIKIFGGAAEEDPALATTHCVIRGNEISHCGKRYAAGCGILANHTSHLEISENHIHHTDYSGISVGWVWGYAPSSTFGNTIRRNHIHHIGMGRLSDMGGIYLLGRQPGTVVSENRIHHVTAAHYGGWGIYTDEGSSDIVIENNVVFCTKHASFHQHYGSNNLVRNNIFAFGGYGVRISRYETHDTVLLQKNIILVDGVPAFEHDDRHQGILSVKSEKNLYWSTNGALEMFNGLSLEEWQNLPSLPSAASFEHDTQQNKDVGSIQADPMFKDANNFDFTLLPDSPATALGFRPIHGFPATEKK